MTSPFLHPVEGNAPIHQPQLEASSSHVVSEVSDDLPKEQQQAVETSNQSQKTEEELSSALGSNVETNLAFQPPLKQAPALATADGSQSQLHPAKTPSHMIKSREPTSETLESNIEASSASQHFPKQDPVFRTADQSQREHPPAESPEKSERGEETLSVILETNVDTEYTSKPLPRETPAPSTDNKVHHQTQTAEAPNPTASSESAPPAVVANIEAPTTPPRALEPSLEPIAANELYSNIPHAIFSPTSSTGLDVDSVSADTDHSDADSAVGESINSSTYSTNSSIFNFIEENGRTYHRFKDGKYYLPNDEIERDRLDLQHHMCGLSFGALYLAPLENLEGGIRDVLDIATGTGIWAIEFAEQFPEAVIKGTDLSPIQPDYVPPNLHFEVDDAEDAWVYSHQFDYIHGRMLVSCFQSHLAVFKSAFDALRPGGYIELQDASFPFMGADDKWIGSAFQRWWRMLMDASRALGKDWNRVPRYKSYLEELGFVDVVERKFPCPIGPWARGEKNKILGVWARANMLQALGGLSMAILTRGLGMTIQQIEVLLVDVRNDINKNGSESLHLYAPLYVVYGRKPS